MQPQPGGPPYQPRIWYANAGEWSRANVDRFLEMVSAQDPTRAAEMSVLYAIRDRIDHVTIALIIANFLLAVLIGATFVLR